MGDIYNQSTGYVLNENGRWERRDAPEAARKTSTAALRDPLGDTTTRGESITPEKRNMIEDYAESLFASQLRDMMWRDDQNEDAGKQAERYRSKLDELQQRIAEAEKAAGTTRYSATKTEEDLRSVMNSLPEEKRFHIPGVTGDTLSDDDKKKSNAMREFLQEKESYGASGNYIPGELKDYTEGEFKLLVTALDRHSAAVSAHVSALEYRDDLIAQEDDAKWGLSDAETSEGSISGDYEVNGRSAEKIYNQYKNQEHQFFSDFVDHHSGASIEDRDAITQRLDYESTAAAFQRHELDKAGAPENFDDVARKLDSMDVNDPHYATYCSYVYHQLNTNECKSMLGKFRREEPRRTTPESREKQESKSTQPKPQPQPRSQQRQQVRQADPTQRLFEASEPPRTMRRGVQRGAMLATQQPRSFRMAVLSAIFSWFTRR